MPTIIEQNGRVIEVEEEICPDCGEEADFYDNAYHCDYCNQELFVWHGESGAFWGNRSWLNPDDPREITMCA